MDIRWKFRTLDLLNEDEMYELLKLRAKIFVVDRQYTYLGGLDNESIHLIGFETNQVAAYCRISPPSLKQEQVVISRIIVDRIFRGKGLGHKTVEKSIEYIRSKWESNILLNTQTYLESFYLRHGFKTVSKEYDIEGVPHLDMELSK